MKHYIVNGVQRIYEDGQAPEGAVEVKVETKAVEETKNKMVTPANKAKKVSKK